MSINSQAQNNSDIAFEVSFTEPQAHYVDVEMTINNIKKDDIILKMPVWAPGSYLVREFSKNVEDFTASANNERLATEKVRKNAWKINTKGKKSITVKYRVYSFEVSVRTSFVDESHAFLSSTGVFMYPEGSLNQPSTVTVIPHKNWKKVSTGLEPVAGKKFTYYAKNFDWLFDSPIEVGNQDVFEFMASGVRHEVAMVGGGNYDKEKLKIDMAKIVERETAVFGENPNKYYVFIVHNYLSGGGGLEHLNSTVLGASRDGYTNPKTYQGFLGLVAHEYFHLWNIKRLRPVALGPFDYDNENYTTNLWIGEGFTAYYDNIIVQRIGAYTPNQWLSVIEDELNAVDNKVGNKSQTLSEGSFDAWIKYYRPNENSNNTTISYYMKGSLVACLLDLQIIEASGAKQSLDDAMRYAYNEYYKKKGRGYTDAEFKAVLEKFTKQNLDQFYADYINGTKSLDFNKYLNYAGFKLVEQATDQTKPYLGISVSKTNSSEIATVSRNTAAWNAGLNVKDEIISINGQRVSNALTYVENVAVGDELDFLINRDGIMKNIKVKIKTSPSKKVRMQQLESPTEKQKAVLEKWLSL
ncbi:M61 family metallopeptidase [Pedobacter arcticus]|uniref:M61 family metallopeptidase n=1 Tax=Pedobacter arcticus TaxID=752140 RepID=UPI0003635760|nr:PDZ domain-containing protein [Pedobacter arcticus]